MNDGQLQVQYRLVQRTISDKTSNNTIEDLCERSENQSKPGASISPPQKLQHAAFSTASVEGIADNSLPSPQSIHCCVGGIKPKEPALHRTDSSESFESVPKEPFSQQQNSLLHLDEGSDVNKKQFQAVAERYVEARMNDDFAVLKEVLSSSVVIHIQRPWGGSTLYRGWDQCQQYFKESKAEPGVNFRNWKHSDTEVSSFSIATVQWVWEVYKIGWRNVTLSMTVLTDGYSDKSSITSITEKQID